MVRNQDNSKLASFVPINKVWKAGVSGLFEIFIKLELSSLLVCVFFPNILRYGSYGIIKIKDREIVTNRFGPLEPCNGIVSHFEVNVKFLEFQNL